MPKIRSETSLPSSVTRPLFVSAVVLFFALSLLLIWAFFAPLATTIRASGTLASSAPSYDLQHQFGGHINQVHVELQSRVISGQPIFEFDVGIQIRNLEILKEQILKLKSENTLARESLGLQSRDSGITLIDEEVARRHHETKLQLEADVKSARATELAARARAVSLADSIGFLEERVSALQDRSDNMASLVSKGILAAAQTEGQLDLLLSVKSQINQQVSERIQLEDQADQAAAQVQSLRTKYRVTLLNQLKTNSNQLPRLEREAVNLQSEIDNAVVRSPIDGVVVALGYDTERMYASRGTTLLTLSQPLRDPSVHFIIPTQAIDQVRAGMEGLLTIPALPQRNLPKIKVKLKSVAPAAKKDAEGNILGYPAQADIDEQDIEKFSKALNGDLQLATDMPVSVAIEGRKVTFANYLFAPFMVIFEGSLQD